MPALSPITNTYFAGDQVIVSTYLWPLTTPVVDGFLAPNGQQTGFVLADPTTVTLTYRVNQGSPVTLTTSSTPAIVKDGTGLYHVVLDTTNLPGLWTYRWQGTGAVVAQRTRSFIVRALPV